MTMEFGETIATTAEASHLVVTPLSSAAGGQSYTFRFQATNRFGMYDYDTITIKAARPPRGGNLTVTPGNGTAMITNFNLATANSWTSDDQSYPLKYTFSYTSPATSSRIVIKALSKVMNYTTRLPDGDSGRGFLLTTQLRCTDVVGCQSELSRTVTVKLPISQSVRRNIVTLTIASVTKGAVAASDVSSTKGSLQLLYHGNFGSDCAIFSTVRFAPVVFMA